MTFSDKKVLVTGASRGIGRAIAKAYKDKGAWVIGTRTGRKKKQIAFAMSGLRQIFPVSSRLKIVLIIHEKLNPIYW